MVHAPEDASFAPGYYSTLFEDPDGVRLEVNFVPGAEPFPEALHTQLEAALAAVGVLPQVGTRLENQAVRVGRRGLLGRPITPEGVEDLLWTIFMLPEFQFVN